MKYLGFIFLLIGFLAGALFSVLNAANVHWLFYIISIIFAVVGIVILRIASKKESQHEDVVTENIISVEESLKRIVVNIEKLDIEKDDIYTYDVHGKIDSLFLHDLNEFVDARKSIIHTFGLSAYADVMTNFAAGERYLNRVWSASVDGYIDEVNQYITKAKDQFKMALNIFDGLIAENQ